MKKHGFAYSAYSQFVSFVLNYGTSQDKKILYHINLCLKCYDSMDLFFFRGQKEFGNKKKIEMMYKCYLICQ